MPRWIRAFAGSNRGTAAVEFAILVPVLLLFAAGVTEFGRYFAVSDAANRLATQYAAAWADCSDVPAGTCSTELSTFASANVIANVAPQLIASRTTLTMFQVSMSGTTPTIVSAYPSGGALSAPQVTAARASFTNGQSGVVVTVAYNHSLAYFSNLMSPYLSSLLSISYTVTQLKS